MEVKAVKVAVVGNRGCGKTCCLLRLLGIDLSEMCECDDGQEQPARVRFSDAREEGSRTLSVCGPDGCVTEVEVYIVVPPAPNTVSSASLAITYRRVDVVVCVCDPSCEDSVEAVPAAFRAALQHAPTSAVRVLLANHRTPSADTKNGRLVASTVGAHFTAGDAMAASGSLWGSAFEAVLNAIARHKAFGEDLDVLLPRPWIVPNLLELCRRSLRDHASDVPGGLRGARQRLPADLVAMLN